MPRRSSDPVDDFFVTVTQPSAARLSTAQAHQRKLEDYPSWSPRSDSTFLMEMGENLFHLAFPTPNAVADFATQFAAAVAANAMFRL